MHATKKESTAIVLQLTTFFFPFLGSDPKGVDDLWFHTYGEFSPPHPSAAPPSPISQTGGPYPSLKTEDKRKGGYEEEEEGGEISPV